MITVMGAATHLGRQIADQLLLAGEEVRVLARHVDKVAEFKPRGAWLAIGDAGDANFLRAAFKTSDAIFASLPHASESQSIQQRTTDAIVTALDASKARYVVVLSNVDPDEVASPVVENLRRQERRLHRLNTNVLILRASRACELDDIVRAASTRLQGWDWEGVVTRDVRSGREPAHAFYNQAYGRMFAAFREALSPAQLPSWPKGIR